MIAVKITRPVSFRVLIRDGFVALLAAILFLLRAIEAGFDTMIIYKVL
jgi:hypothetical protein